MTERQTCEQITAYYKKNVTYMSNENVQPCWKRLETLLATEEKAEWERIELKQGE